MPASVCNPIGEWHTDKDSLIDRWECIMDGHYMIVVDDGYEYGVHISRNDEQWGYDDPRRAEDVDYLVMPGEELAAEYDFSTPTQAMVAAEHWVLTR